MNLTHNLRKIWINQKFSSFDFWKNIFKIKAKYKQTSTIVLSITAALFFLIISSTQLTKQGLYYDELHQATSSFAYIGQYPSQEFARLIIDGIPVMNMEYSGAIKTAIYGLYLRVTGASFSVFSWRILGILFVSFAIFLFGFIIRKTLPLLGLLSFYFLMLTDLTVLLTTRHDWGPVALALSIRLIIVAIWFKGELSSDTPLKNSFWLSFLVGISLFEKLSAITLVIPLFLMFFLSPRRRNLRHILVAIIGGIVGVSPLIFVNIYSFITTKSFISLQSAIFTQTRSWGDFILFIKEYLSLGAGELAQNFILGHSQHFLSIIELVQLSLMCLFIIFVVVRSRLSSNFLRLAGIMLLCYGSVVLILFFIPQNIWIHHWIIGTPFQYAAIALFLSVLKDEKKIYKYMAVILSVTIIFSRLLGLVMVEQSLIRGDASARWDPSLTQIGEFAASKSDQAYFIAGDWGVASQMICFLNGRPGIVYELYDSNLTVESVVNIIREGSRSEVYLVFPDPLVFITPEAKTLMIHEIEQSLAPSWQEQPVEKQVSGLRSVSVIKLEKTKSP